MKYINIRLAAYITFLPCVCLGGFVATAPASAQAPASYDALIKSATDLLAQDKSQAKSAEASDAALKATVLDPARWEGYFYCAVAYYRQDLLDTAEDFAKKAKERAPEASQAAITVTLSTIDVKRQFLSLVKSADKEAADSLRAKAAADYGAAWRLFPDQSATGMKSVLLWRDLQEWKECARIAQAIAAVKSDPKSDEALAICKELTPKFDAVVADDVNKASLLRWGDKIKEADALLSEAIEVDPGRYEPKLLLGLLRVTATTDKATIVTGWPLLTQAIAAGNLQVDDFFNSTSRRIAKREDLTELAKTDEFKTLIKDALGPTSVEKITPALDWLSQYSLPSTTSILSDDLGFNKAVTDGDMPKLRLFVSMAGTKAEILMFDSGSYVGYYSEKDALSCAVGLNSLTSAKFLLDTKASFTRSDLITMIASCVAGNKRPMIRVLIARCKSLIGPNSWDFDKLYHGDPECLVWACIYGDVEVLDLAIEKGVDVTKLSSASFLESWDLGHLGSIKYTYLQEVCRSSNPDKFPGCSTDGQVQVVTSLIKAGCDVNKRSDEIYSDYSWTPLHSAAYNGRLDLVRVLLENKADKSARTKKSYMTQEPNKTAEDLARGNGHQDVADFIKNWKR